MAKKKNSKYDHYIVLNLAISAIFTALYFCGIWFLNRLIYQDALFFCPKGSIIFAFFNCAVILIATLFLNKSSIKWWKAHKRKRLLLSAIGILLLLLPLLFMKSGTVADGNSIRKINSFGQVTHEYSYKDIEKVEFSVRFGLQYEITFQGKKPLLIRSHETFLLNGFGNAKNMVAFDQLISKNAEKEIYWDIYMTPNNVHRFIKEKEAIDYFDSFLKEYY